LDNRELINLYIREMRLGTAHRLLFVIVILACAPAWIWLAPSLFSTGAFMPYTSGFPIPVVCWPAMIVGFVWRLLVSARRSRALRVHPELQRMNPIAWLRAMGSAILGDTTGVYRAVLVVSVFVPLAYFAILLAAIILRH
jgi:hypothetical protein